MARSTKKKELSPEEKLAAALVPEKEQPYKVPENWCWVRLEKLYKINPKNDASEDMDAGFVPMEMISSGMSQSFEYTVQPWYQAKKGHTQFADGDVAFAKISPCFENRKSMIVNELPNGIGGGTTELIVLRQPLVNQHFTFWLVSTEDFIQKGRQTYSGTVGQQRINMDYVRKYPVPLPPLPEQQRIVNLIESLFADLDEAKKKLTTILEGFAQRKSAILHRAFTGELTERWREESGKPLSNWRTAQLEDDFYIVGGVQKQPSRKPDKNPVPYITVANVYRNRIDISDLRFFEVYDGELEKYQLKYGDILLVEGNGSGSEIGRCAMWRDELPICIHQNHIIRARKRSESVLPEFVLYYLNSPIGNQIMQERARTTAGLYSLSTGKIKKIPIPQAPIDEQKEIVRILDEIFAKEQQAQSVVESVLADIELLKKSILARAFRGELGTGNPEDERAEELLKRVL